MQRPQRPQGKNGILFLRVLRELCVQNTPDWLGTFPAAARAGDDDVHNFRLSRLAALSIVGPDTRRRQLHRAIVRIAEIEAEAAALPGDAALDADAEFRKPRLPR